jgi:DNA-directed RNA polymerase I subunit RPA2
MLIESMAGKAGAIHGIFQDASPFQFHENTKVIDYVGEQLRLFVDLDNFVCCC